MANLVADGATSVDMFAYDIARFVRVTPSVRESESCSYSLQGSPHTVTPVTVTQ